MSDPQNDVLDTAAQWLAGNHPTALATVTRTWGSAPRPAGSQMAVRGDGAFAGSVSGGCVEGAVMQEAQAALQDGRVRNLKFGVSDADAWAVGLACGGTIEVHVAPLVGPLMRETLPALEHLRAKGLAAVVATDLDSGETRLLRPDSGATDDWTQAAAKAARQDRSMTADIEGRSWFFTVYNPPLDLAIIGAVHMAQPLTRIAGLADYAVRVIDPRTAFATPERFPEVRLSHQWPDEALAAEPLTARSALVALTHDPKLDDPALAAALSSPAFYIGALGSKTTHAKRLERLRAAGFSESQLGRIHGPIGLDIGARAPAEIAVAILAQMTQTLRRA
jgi:xanthine dehydrogenase accessory factor